MPGNDDTVAGPASDRQWWLTAGTEFCSFCEAQVHAEVLTYCLACDRGMCWLCLYEGAEPGLTQCPECEAERREST